MSEEKEIDINVGQTVIIDPQYSSLSKKGVVIGVHLDRCVVQLKDGSTRSVKEIDFITYDEIKKEGKISRAYKIWAVGMSLSLLGILGGQWLGEFYKEPIVYYIVSGIWATLIGGSSAVIGLIILSKSDIK